MRIHARLFHAPDAGGSSVSYIDVRIKKARSADVLYPVTKFSNIRVTPGTGVQISGNSISLAKAVAGTSATANAGCIAPDSACFTVSSDGALSIKPASTTQYGIMRIADCATPKDVFDTISSVGAAAGASGDSIQVLSGSSVTVRPGGKYILNASGSTTLTATGGTAGMYNEDAYITIYTVGGCITQTVESPEDPELNDYLTQYAACDCVVEYNDKAVGTLHVIDRKVGIGIRSVEDLVAVLDGTNENTYIFFDIATDNIVLSWTGGETPCTYLPSHIIGRGIDVTTIAYINAAEYGTTAYADGLTHTFGDITVRDSVFAPDDGFHIIIANKVRFENCSFRNIWSFDINAAATIFSDEPQDYEAFSYDKPYVELKNCTVEGELMGEELVVRMPAKISGIFENDSDEGIEFGESVGIEAGTTFIKHQGTYIRFNGPRTVINGTTGFYVQIKGQTTKTQYGANGAGFPSYV